MRPPARKADDDAPGTLSDYECTAVAETFRALGDPTRTRIVDLISGAEVSVNALAMRLGISPSAVSHHLRTLRQMRLVRVRREGQEAFYTLDDPHIGALLGEARRHVEDYVRRGPEGSES